MHYKESADEGETLHSAPTNEGRALPPADLDGTGGNGLRPGGLAHVVVLLRGVGVLNPLPLDPNQVGHGI